MPSLSFAVPQVPTNQQPAPANRADKTQSLIEEGERLASSGKRAEAHKVLSEALARAREEKNPASETRALMAIGRNLSAQGKYKEALENLEPALALAETRGEDANVARACNSIAIVYQYLGQGKDAERYYRRAIAGYEKIGNLAGKANSLINLSFIIGPKEKEATSLLTEAADIARKLGDKSLEARALHNLADGLYSESEFAQAMEFLERAEKLLVGSGDAEDLPGVYTSMGRLHRVHGLLAEAIPYYEKALEIEKKLGNSFGVIQSLNAIATAHLTLGELEGAGGYYEQALALARETRSPRLIRFMLGSLAVNLVSRGENAKAALLFEEVLQGAADENTSNRHTNLGRAYAGLGRVADAEREMNAGVEFARKNNQADRLVHALTWRAWTFLRSGQAERALGDAQEATALLEGLRKKLVPSDFMRQGLTQYHQYIYAVRIQLHEAQGESQKALEVAELARSRAFLDLLATRESLGMDSGAGAPDSGKLASFANATPDSAAQIAATAARLRSTVLAYWTTPDAVFIWAVNPDGRISSARADIRLQRLEQLVRRTQEVAPQSENSPTAPQKGAQTRGDSQVVLSPPPEAWRELYDLLIRPIRTRLPARGGRLTIIPHGPLLRLSFAALQDEKGRYVLENYALHYAPSATLLEFTARRKKAGESGAYFPMLIVADPALRPPKRGDRVLPPLPGALQEGRTIAKMAPPGEARLLSGSEAVKSAVRDAMPGRAVVHFATHGVVRDDAPLDSYLALASRADDEDGRLKAEEIYSLNLQANLIVLSACRSGGGKLTGDGIAALARAFFYAGTPSLMVTLWDVADQPSKELLPGFYRAWLRGQEKSEALRTAQLRLLRDLRAGKVRVQTPAGTFVLPEHPMFWAGYILLGEP